MERRGYFLHTCKDGQDCSPHWNNGLQEMSRGKDDIVKRLVCLVTSTAGGHMTTARDHMTTARGSHDHCWGSHDHC